MPQKPDAGLTLLVLIFVEPQRRREFTEFEAAASRIMKRHGGALERRVVFSSGGDPDRPDEVHVVTFPDRASLERYRADPELQALKELRAAAISRTVFWEGRDAPVFDLPTGGRRPRRCDTAPRRRPSPRSSPPSP